MKVSRIILIVLLAGVCFAQKRDGEFAALADRFFDEVVFKYDPVQGTQAGFHQYDAMLGSGSRAEIEAQTAALHKFEQEVERLRCERTFAGGGGRPGTGAGADSRATADVGSGPPVGEESGHLLLGRLERGVCDHEPEFRAGGGAAEIGDRARKADAAAVSIGAREPQESAANLHRNCVGTDAGHRQLLSERCARGIQERERRSAAGGIQESQPGSDRRAQRL